MQRLRVIYLSEPHINPRYVIDAIGSKHDLFVFDPSAPLAAAYGWQQRRDTSQAGGVLRTQRGPPCTWPRT